MSDSGRVLVAGMGSAHGDDQAGWLVVESISEQFRIHPGIVVRRAMIPLDLLDWLDGIDILHVCDAGLVCDADQDCDSEGIGDARRTTSRGRKLRRCTWHGRQRIDTENAGESEVSTSLSSQRSRGSHDFGLSDVLRLAESTGLLPKQVIIWAIEGKCFQPDDVMSHETRETALQAVHELAAELSLCHA